MRIALRSGTHKVQKNDSALHAFRHRWCNALRFECALLADIQSASLLFFNLAVEFFSN